MSDILIYVVKLTCNKYQKMAHKSTFFDYNIRIRQVDLNRELDSLM